MKTHFVILGYPNEKDAGSVHLEPSKGDLERTETEVWGKGTQSRLTMKPSRAHSRGWAWDLEGHRFFFFFIAVKQSESWAGNKLTLENIKIKKAPSYNSFSFNKRNELVKVRKGCQSRLYQIRWRKQRRTIQLLLCLPLPLLEKGFQHGKTSLAEKLFQKNERPQQER